MMAAAKTMIVATICYCAIGFAASSHAENAGAAAGLAMPNRMVAPPTNIPGNAAGASDPGSPNTSNDDGTSGPAGSVSVSAIDALNSYLGSVRTGTTDTDSPNYSNNDGTSGPAGSVSMSSINALNSYLDSRRGAAAANMPPAN